MPPAFVDFETQSKRQQQNPSSYKSRTKPRLPKRRHVAKNPNLDFLYRAMNDPISGSFVFGTSDRGLNLPKKENEMKKSNDGFVLGDQNYGFVSDDRSNFENLKKTEVVSGLSSGFVFGTSLKNPNLNVEMGKGSNGFVSSDLNNCENLKKTEPDSGLSSGFVFGTSLEKPNLNMEMGKSSNGFVSSDLNNGPISSSFVFGTSECGFNKPNKENEMKERNDRSNFENLKKTELGSGLSSGFVFGTSLKNPNLNVEMGKGSNGLVSSDLNNCENLKKTEPNSGLSSGFVFGTSLEKPNLNVEMGIKNDGFVSSDLNSGSNVKNPGLVSGLSNGFVFGASGSGLENPSLNVEMKSTIDGFVSDSKKTDFVTGLSNGFVSDSKKTDFVTGLSKGFVFGKSGSVLENPSLNVETKQSNTGFANLNSKCNEPNKKDEPGRSFSGGFVFSTGNSSFNTRKPEPDRRNPRKLGSIFKKASTQSNGNEDRKVFENCAEPQKEKGDDVFVFGSSKKVNSSSTDCENLSGDINKLNAKDCRSHTSFVNNKQNFVFGKNVCAPRVNITDKLSDDMSRLNVTESNEKDKLGDVKKPLVNPCTLTDPVFVFEGSGKSGVAVSEKSIKFGHLFETFKEKPPTIAKERSSNNAFVGICTPKSFTSQAGQGQSFAQFEDQVNDYTKSKEKFSQSYFSADLFNVEAFSIGRVEGKNNFSFSTPSRDASSSFAENLATSFSKHPDYSEKSRSVKNKKWKKLSHKSRKVDPIQQQPSKNNEGSQQKAESPGHFSPMDFSPYQDDQCASSSNERADTNKEESSKLGQGNVDFSKNFWERFAAEYPFEQAETVGRSSGTGQVSTNNNDDGAAADTFSKKSVSKEEKECTSRKDDGTERNSGSFSMSNEDNVSATKRRSMRKYRTKVGSSPNNIDPSCQADSSYSHLYTDQNKERSTINSQRPATVWRVKNSAKGDEKHSNHQPTGFMKVKNNVEAQNACEKWRIRGNQAYEKGQSSKAEEYYTKGIDSFVNKGSPEGSIEPLVLCYSNRAAARMLCGRMREALSDCVMADSLDPSFQKVQLRAANCHLALGEIAEACQYFNKCLESNGYICLDRRSAIEAASGLQKAQNLASCLSHCAELLRQKTLAAANSALESISSVFPTSSYSEKLLELKGEALFMLQRYKEAIQLCETTLDLAEKNFAIIAGDNNSVNINDTKSKYSTIKLWRWRLMSKSYFHLGKLELALELLEKQEALSSSDERSNTEDLSFPIAATVREFLHHKNAGNRAFQSGKHTEAVEHYSAAVSGRIESRPFAAVCFCNRAAAQQALGQLSDAISGCSIAIALDGTYSKAVSRRATLHEKIRDYGSATNDLQILISLLKEQSQKDKINRSAGDDTSSNNNTDELRQAHIRLSSIEEKAKKGLPLDHYLILGVKSTDEASELKKAYRRAALRHHPDKAGQFLARGDTGDDGRLWKDLCEEIQKDADRLFKLIGEAYAVLSDPNKRPEYDLQEELRNVRKENRNQDSTRSYDFYGSPSKNRRNNGCYSQESWKTYGYSPSRW